MTVSPPAAAAFPGNRVAFWVPHSSTPGMAIEREDGTAVAASVKKLSPGERTFAPDAPLEAGKRYHLRYDQGCFINYGNDLSPPAAHADMASGPASVEFTTTAAAEVPTSIGTLRVVRREQKENGESAWIALTPSPELLPFRDLVELRWTVDGRRWYSPPSNPFRPALIELQPEPELWVFGGCAQAQPTDFGGDTCGFFYVAPGGRRRVQVTAHIRGLATDPPPAALDLDVGGLPCGEHADAGMVAFPDAGPPPGAPDAGPSDAQPSVPSEVAPLVDTSGCRYGTRGAASPITLALAALALLAVRRRRLD